MQKRLRCIVSGRVQLVMYRDFTRRKARRFDLVGWVKNLPDNTVEVVAEGEEKDLKRFLAELWEGPLLADVEDISCTWWNGVSKEFKSFEIKYE